MILYIQFPPFMKFGERRIGINIDRYAVISTLSHHPHGIVWLAEHKSIGVKRIIKGIPKSLIASGGTGEAEILKNLAHQSIPELYDIFEYEDYLCLVEEYFEGESLTELCRSRLLSSKEVIDFITQICSIIQYLHTLPEAVLHLDLKPDNIMIDGGKIRLIDFGSAIRLKGNSRGKTVSRGFTAPEQGARLKVDRGTDVYALGKVLEFMVSHSNAGEDITRRLRKISDCCCTEKPWKRVSSAETMLKMLKKLKRSETDKRHMPQKPAHKAGDGCRTVGVIGLGPRSGTTHVAIALANYLADVKGFEVCLVEKSDHSDINLIPEVIRATRNSDSEPVRINGVTYLTSGFAYEGEFLKNRRFDCIVYDLGSNLKKAELTLSDCDTEIAVGSAAPWREEEYRYFVQNTAQGEDERITKIMINPADTKMMRNMTAGRIGMFPFPFEPDPMHPGKETIKILERAIG